MKKSTKKLLIAGACIVAVIAAPNGIWRLVHRPELAIGESEKFTQTELLLAVETVSAHLAKEGMYVKSMEYDEAASEQMLERFHQVTDKENSVWFTADVRVDWMVAPIFHGDNAAVMGGSDDFGWTLTR